MGHVAKGPMARKLVTEGLIIAHLSIASRALWAPGCGGLLGETLRGTREKYWVRTRHGLAVTLR